MMQILGQLQNSQGPAEPQLLMLLNKLGIDPKMLAETGMDPKTLLQLGQADATKNLMRIAAIKQAARQLGIEKIDAADRGGYLIFGANADIDPVALVQLVQNSDSSYRLQGSHRLQFHGEFGDIENRFVAVERLVERLAG